MLFSGQCYSSSEVRRQSGTRPFRCPAPRHQYSLCTCLFFASGSKLRNPGS